MGEAYEGEEVAGGLLAGGLGDTAEAEGHFHIGLYAEPGEEGGFLKDEGDFVLGLAGGVPFDVDGAGGVVGEAGYDAQEGAFAAAAGAYQAYEVTI